MSNLWQVAGDRWQAAGDDPASRISHLASRKRGFTLVEMLLAVSLSVMVFFAMGTLLGKCFSLWKDASANWQLSQVARISRERILCGGFANPQDGLLSATNVTVNLNSGWSYVEYVTAAGSGVVERTYGWSSQADADLLLLRGAWQWAFGQTVANYSYSYETPVKVDSFTASSSNDIVTISYRLHVSAAGKTFTLPHTIQACLVNKGD